MADLDSLSNSELREKLLEYGYDIPSSVSKDFLLKKLQMVIKEPAKTGTGRKSVGRLSKVPTPPAPVRPVSIVPPSNASVTRRSTGRQLPARNNEREEQLNNSRITTKPPVGRSRNSTPPRIPARSPSRRSQPQQPQIHLGSKDDEDEESEEEDVDMPEVHNRSVGHLSRPRASASQPIRRATPPRSSLRPNSAAATKRVRLDNEDSPPPPKSPLKRNISQISQNETSFLSRSNLSSSLLSTSTTSGPGYTGGFSIIVNGRKVQSDCIPNTVIDPKKFIFNVPDADAIEYVVVFLNENQNFEAGTAGQVYFGWPDERNEIKWHELGHISNIRPSAIFNVSDLKQAVTVSGNRTFSYGIFPSATRTTGRQLSGPTTAQIGVSIEPLEVIVSSMRPHIQL